MIEADLDLTEWRNLLKKILVNGTRAADILKAVFNIFGFEDIQDHFKKQEGNDGAWEKRSPGTQELYAMIASGRRSPPKGNARAAYNPSNPVLHLSGKLRQSFLPTNVKRLTQNSILIFSNSKYSGIHDQGDSSRNLPRRSFMWLSEGALDKMGQTTVQMWIGDK